MILTRPLYRSTILTDSQNTVLNRLPVVVGAAFDSYAEQHNTGCHPDTRVELLKGIYTWADDLEAQNIFWLSGIPGTGKSTV